MSVFVWKPHWQGERVDMDRCRASVHDDSGVGFHQCARKATVFVDGIGWCKQHSPGEAQRRKQQSRAKVDRALAAMDERNKRSSARIRMVVLVGELRDNGWILTDELTDALNTALKEAGL